MHAPVVMYVFALGGMGFPSHHHHLIPFHPIQSVYVRSPHGHDLGTVLKKAVFTLHPSFINHIRGTSPSLGFVFVCGQAPGLSPNQLSFFP